MIKIIRNYFNSLRMKKQNYYDDKSVRKTFISSDFPQFYLDLLESFNEKFSLSGMTVIDVGGSNIPAEVMQSFGVKKFVCLDPVTKWGYGLKNGHCFSKKVFKISEFEYAFKNEYSFVIDEDIENIGKDLNLMFDVVISFSTFEHVTSIKKTLDVIYGILKKPGILYSQYEPIFSCPDGHHVYISNDYNFNNMPEIEHMHLLYNREEAVHFLNTITRFNVEIKNKIIQQAYESKVINRFMINEHIDSFQKSKFNKHQITYLNMKPVSEERINIFNKKYGRMRYDVRGIQYFAYKY